MVQIPDDDFVLLLERVMASYGGCLNHLLVARVLLFIAKERDTVDIRRIVTHTGARRPAVNDALRHLARHGLAQQEGKGLWRFSFRGEQRV